MKQRNKNSQTAFSACRKAVVATSKTAQNRKVWASRAKPE